MQSSLGPKRINRQLAGAPIQLQERTLQPVAHVTGWTRSLTKGGGAWLHARPVEVLVTDADGRTYRVPITVSRNDAVRWLALAGALVLPLNWLVRRALVKRKAS